MHTIEITPNLLFEYQCTSGTFIRLPNRIESKLFLPELECSSARLAITLSALARSLTLLQTQLHAVVDAVRTTICFVRAPQQNVDCLLTDKRTRVVYRRLSVRPSVCPSQQTTDVVVGAKFRQTETAACLLWRFVASG